MRRALMIALASATFAAATPAMAAVTLNAQTGPDLDTKIYASGDQGVATTGTTVYGNTSNGAGHNVAFTGYDQGGFTVNSNGTVTTGTQTTIAISGGNGFAQVYDPDFTQSNSSVPTNDNLYTLVMNPVPTFSLYEFSVQTLAGGTVSVYYTIDGSTWLAALGNPTATGNGDTQFIVGDASNPSLAIDQVAIVTSSPIEHVKQNSIELTGDVPAVPEPATWGMMLLGFAGVGFAMRRSRRGSDALMQVA